MSTQRRRLKLLSASGSKPSSDGAPDIGDGYDDAAPKTEDVPSAQPDVMSSIPLGEMTATVQVVVTRDGPEVSVELRGKWPLGTYVVELTQGRLRRSRVS